MAWTWAPPKNNITTGQTGRQTPGQWYWSGNPNNIDFGSKPTQPPPHAKIPLPGTPPPKKGQPIGVTTTGRIPGPYPGIYGTPIRIYGGTVPKGLKSSNAPPNKMYPVTKRIRTMQTRIFGFGPKPGQRGIAGHFPKQMKTYIGLTKRGGIGLKKYGGLTPGNLSIPGVKGPRGSLTNLTPKFGGDPKMHHKLGLLPWVPGKGGTGGGNSGGNSGGPGGGPGGGGPGGSGPGGTAEIYFPPGDPRANNPRAYVNPETGAVLPYVPPSHPAISPPTSGPCPPAVQSTVTQIAVCQSYPGNEPPATIVACNPEGPRPVNTVVGVCGLGGPASNAYGAFSASIGNDLNQEMPMQVEAELSGGMAESAGEDVAF